MILMKFIFKHHFNSITRFNLLLNELAMAIRLILTVIYVLFNFIAMDLTLVMWLTIYDILTKQIMSISTVVNDFLLCDRLNLLIFCLLILQTLRPRYLISIFIFCFSVQLKQKVFLVEVLFNFSLNNTFLNHLALLLWVLRLCRRVYIKISLLFSLAESSIFLVFIIS